MSAGEQVKFLLSESEIPTHWVNLTADLPGDPLPPLHPATKQPLGPDDLAPLFPMALIEQEVSAEPEIEIPDEVRDVYKLWRPTPLLRAHLDRWFAERPQRPEGVASGDWLSWEQDKHERLLALEPPPNITENAVA